jgi:nicotinamide riboside transporter PnuC
MLISYIAAIFSLSGIWFNIRKNPLCWFLFMASDSMWLIYSILTKQWAMTISHTIFMVVNFYGLYTWSYKKHGAKDDKKNISGTE